MGLAIGVSTAKSLEGRGHGSRGAASQTGHSDLKTTTIYAHVLTRGPMGMISSAGNGADAANPVRVMAGLALRLSNHLG